MLQQLGLSQFLEKKPIMRLFGGSDCKFDMEIIESRFLNYSAQFFFRDNFYLTVALLRYQRLQKNCVFEPKIQNILINQICDYFGALTLSFDMKAN